ncbi:DNA polymerase Y family protein [Frankia sp. AgB1.9]|uniref:DNA polymerase Y family protein n=1 Tax=unclassified Frankia TaxID=2632575 RepID=UPI001932D4A4|nr:MULTISPECIES: DNA polymerase Y family protein [unclassified Frankia]MBL7488728.1 DNA polymerase Y family protein [Frankia sp. AgW1.1]MBL7546790.1 DNA polymerase Y family protein [Frankia sp. AgB1.9]MBL7623583.1 DNA polymerase Y family protein [Frankia sp. AgB1.8]
MPVRMLAVHCPDWPTLAAGIGPEVPAAVVEANRVVTATAAARAAGVLPGLRRRDAQGRCPQLRLLAADSDRDARVFEPVVAAVETVVPGAEVTRPGDCLVPVRGAARYFGAEALVIAQIRGAVAAVAGNCRIGIADGPFAAGLAGRLGETVPAGASAGFLAGLPVELVDRPELAGLLRRLGLPTLGAFAALPAAQVLDRFGPDGALVHRLARGDDERLPEPRVVPSDLTVDTLLDPPADTVEQVVFTARRLAEDCHAKLLAAGLACARVAIEAETENGERLRRVWRHDGPLTAAAITDRIRWQLDGWLSAAALASEASRAAPPGTGYGPGSAGTGHGPTAGVTWIRVVPEDLLAADGRQLGLWGEPGAADGRVRRALDRVQGLLGPEAVLTAEVRGGRDPATAVRLVPWGEPRGPRDATEADRAGAPWPGRLPAPAPATVLTEPRPALLLDAAGEPVVVSGRTVATKAPAWLAVDGRPPVRVTGWAGPWPADERWWEPSGRRRARFQLTTEDGDARLLFVEGGRWWWEASYG